MLSYLIRRLLLVVPTLFAILAINFVVIQIAPGGPIEQIIAQLQGLDADATARATGGTGGDFSGPQRPAGSTGGPQGNYRGSQGLDPAFVAQLEQQFGFDRPLPERFVKMVGDFLTFDFGESYFRQATVIDLIIEKMPVSISLGLWTMLLTYLVAIPLGIAKAVRDGAKFDVWTSTILIVGNAIPSFLFAILLIVVFAGGRYFNWFPLGGLVSDNWDALSWPQKILDYLWHMVLPVISMTIGSFAGLAMLTKNSFLDQLAQNYVVTARAKGLTERRVLYGHVFRNGMLIVIAGFPAAFIGILFTGSLLIEIIFNLDGLGLLGFEAITRRDYPIIFGSLYIFTLIGLIFGIINDLMYTLVDPRIDFEKRGG